MNTENDTVTTEEDDLAKAMALLLAKHPTGFTLLPGQEIKIHGAAKRRVTGLDAIKEEMTRMREKVLVFGDLEFAFHYRGLSSREASVLDEMDKLKPPKKVSTVNGVPMPQDDWENPDYLKKKESLTLQKSAATIELATNIKFPGTSAAEKAEVMANSYPDNVLLAILRAIQSVTGNVLEEVTFS